MKPLEFVTMALGVALVMAGAAILLWPAALIVAGLAVMALGWPR